MPSVVANPLPENLVKESLPEFCKPLPQAVEKLRPIGKVPFLLERAIVSMGGAGPFDHFREFHDRLSPLLAAFQAGCKYLIMAHGNATK